MNNQARAFQISFLLHGVIIGLMFLSAPVPEPFKKTIPLDFNLLEPGNKQTIVEPAASFVQTAPTQPPVRERKAQSPPARRESVTPRTPEISPAAELTATKAQLVSTALAEGSDDTGEPAAHLPADAQNGNEAPKKVTNTGDAASAMEPAASKYLNEHFDYIRKKILGNINYPDAAKRMGWQGKVVLSFVITSDGSVRALKIMQSSGFKILDDKAIETIRQAAPFPRPPVEARLMIPVVYHLN
ncbi:MAG TPA: energy transducer TonB [Smithellaceae bacterium]|jgi:protein TonB|nr:energy transducer TonB [Syntrophaceae bacterium]HPV50141.1 energy transducer TonB [Smithellaceae bacterium]